MPPYRNIAVIPSHGNCSDDSDEDLTEEQIIKGLMKLTAESLADEPDYQLVRHMWEDLKKGDIVKIPLSYSDLVDAKPRPALVLYHDMETRQLTVAYITSQISKLGPADILIASGSPTCDTAGLPKTSILKVNWLAVVKRIYVIDKYGEADEILRAQVNKVLPECLAI